MSFAITNRALLRGMLAGAVVLTGTACSRSDRAKSGPDNTAAVAADTSINAAQPSNSGTVTGSVSDTAMSSERSSTSTSEKDAAGYRAMERDTTTPPNQHSDSARVTADSSVSQASPATSDSVTTDMSAVGRASADVADTSGRVTADSSVSQAPPATSDSVTTDMSAVGSASADVADTSAAGYSEMARDTSKVADQADTAAANGDVALSATVDTSAEAGVTADSTDNAGRIRPPEDSTEILGNVTTNEGDETADEQVVRPEDRETVATSETPQDEVGAAAIGGDVTGAEAVALMTREGLRCAVVDLEANQAIHWDMSSTPVSLNPCGMGSMVPSRIWTRVE